MSKKSLHPIWQVFQFEVIRQLKKPSFWIALLLLPLMMLGLFALNVMNSQNLDKELAKKDDSIQKIGVFDQAQILPPKLQAEGYKIQHFNSEKSGIAAAKSQKIDVFYVIPHDFVKTPSVRSFAKTTKQDSFLASGKYQAPIKQVLSFAAATRVQPADSLILSDNFKVSTTIFGEDNNVSNPLGKAIVPIIVLGVFYILICIFGNRMLMTVTEEKENRISEMILTAVSARDLILGKILAIIALGLIQIAVFIIPAFALVFANRDNPMISGIIGSIEFLPLPFIGNLMLLFVSYFFFAGLCTLVGTLVPTARDSSNYLGPVMIGLVLPFFFLNSFIGSSTSLVTYVLSYFPLSAPISLMLRNAFGVLPWYEFLLGITAIAVYASVVLYFTVKSFQKNAINFSVVKPTFAIRKSWKRQ